jgi:hypothetical protein
MNVDVVEPHPGPGDDLQARGAGEQILIDLGVRPHDQAIGLLEQIIEPRQLVVRARDQLAALRKPRGGNRVKLFGLNDQ